MAEEDLLDSFDEETFLDTLAEDTPEVAYSALEHALDPVSFAEPKSIAQSLKDSLANLETSLQSLKDAEFFRADSSGDDSTFPSLAYPQPHSSCGLCLKPLVKPKQCRLCQLKVCADCWINLDKCPQGCPQTVFRESMANPDRRTGLRHSRCLSVGCHTEPSCSAKGILQETSVTIHEECANPLCWEAANRPDRPRPQTLQVCSSVCAAVYQAKQTLEGASKDEQLSVFVRMLKAARTELYEEARASLLTVYAEVDQKRKQTKAYMDRKAGLKKSLEELRTAYIKQCL